MKITLQPIPRPRSIENPSLEAATAALQDSQPKAELALQKKSESMTNKKSARRLIENGTQITSYKASSKQRRR